MRIFDIKQYSNKIRGIKYSLAVIGSLLVLVTMALPFFSPHEERLHISYAKAIDEGGRVKLMNPVLYGEDNKNQPFKILADDGFQSYEGKEAYFNNVIGEMVMSRNQAKMRISAKQCRIDLKDNYLDLVGEVLLHSKNNYDASTDKATMSLESNDVWGEVPIEVHSKSGEIKANKFHFQSMNKVLTFEGRVITIID